LGPLFVLGGVGCLFLQSGVGPPWYLYKLWGWARPEFASYAVYAWDIVGKGMQLMHGIK